MQIVPYFMTGFESVVKGAEEATPEFRVARFFQGHLDGDCGRHSFLHNRDCGRRICCTVAGTDRAKNS